MMLLERPGSVIDAGTPLSLAEYLALPEDTRAEIIDGVLRPMTRATQRHRNIQSLIAAALRACAPGDMRVLEEEIVVLSTVPVAARIPDVVVARVTPGQTWDVTSTPAVDVVLAVEVVSPSTATADHREKPREFALAGIASFWLVELAPETRVTVHHLINGAYQRIGTHRSGGDDVVSDPALPWVALTVTDLGSYS